MTFIAISNEVDFDYWREFITYVSGFWCTSRYTILKQAYIKSCSYILLLFTLKSSGSVIVWPAASQGEGTNPGSHLCIFGIYVHYLILNLPWAIRYRKITCVGYTSVKQLMMCVMFRIRPGLSRKLQPNLSLWEEAYAQRRDVWWCLL